MPPERPSVPPELQEQLAAAASELDSAEQDLRTVLEALPPAVRAEKRIISSAVQAALEKVSTARKRLHGTVRRK